MQGVNADIITFKVRMQRKIPEMITNPYFHVHSLLEIPFSIFRKHNLVFSRQGVVDALDDDIQMDGFMDEI